MIFFDQTNSFKAINCKFPAAQKQCEHFNSILCINVCCGAYINNIN